MSDKRIGAFLFLVLSLGLLSGCIEDQVAPESDVPPSVIAVSVSPASLALPTGGSQTFTAALTGSGNTAVAWSVAEGPAGGAITSAGVYTAPAFPGTYHVIATSLADSGKSATATVTVSSSLDPAFGVNGKVITGFGGNDRINALKLQSDGKILAAGFALNGTKNTFVLARYNADGTLDTGFGTGGKVTTAIGNASEAQAMALQSDGKIVLGGYSFDGKKNNFALARYLSDGSLDTAFGTDGKVTTAVFEAGKIRAMVIQSDGKIVAGGFSLSTFINHFTLARYTSSGALDTSFGTGGIVQTFFGGNSQVASLAMQSDGKIVAGGFAPGALNDFALARYNSNGTPDTSFDGDGLLTVLELRAQEISSVLVQSDGKILAGGFAANASDDDFAVYRFTTTGALDAAFGTGGKAITLIGSGNERINSLAMDPDGKIVAAGFSSNGTDNDFALVRYNADGTLDTSFDTVFEGTVSVTNGSETVTGNNTKFTQDLKVGDTILIDQANLATVAVISSDTALTLSAFYTGVSNPNTTIKGVDPGVDEAKGVFVQPDGKIVAGGFISNTLRSDFALARYDASGSLDGAFGTGGKVVTSIEGGNNEIKAIGMQSNGKIVAAGYAFGVGGKLDNDFALALYNADGSLNGRMTTDISAAESTKDDAANALAIQPADDKILLGGPAFVGAANDFALARYLADGTLDTAFGTAGVVTTPIGSGEDVMNALALELEADQTVKKIVAAGTAFVTDKNVFAVARYGPTGTLDTTFDADGKVTTAVGAGSSFGKAVQVQADGKILVAGLASASNGGGFDFALVRYGASGGLDTSFGTGGIVTTPVGSGHDIANAMALQADGKILVVGGTLTGSPAGVFSIVRYNSDGSLDSGFGAGGIVTVKIGAEGNNDSQALAVRVQSDGKILVGGYVYNIDSKRDFALARFLSDGSLDDTFGVAGKEIVPLGAGIDEIHGLFIQAADGKIVAGGAAFNVNDENADFALTRHDP